MKSRHVAAVAGFAGVALGAFGAHALKDRLSPESLDWWNKAVLYHLVHTAAIRRDYHDAIPLKRYGTPEEIAAAVGFLCSPEASYINGQCLAADGGFDAAGFGLPTLRA